MAAGDGKGGLLFSRGTAVVPVEVVPSPQLIVAEKSAEWSPRIGVGEGGVASVAVIALPSVAVTLAAAEPVSAASATVAVPVVVVRLRPSSLTVTVIGVGALFRIGVAAGDGKDASACCCSSRSLLSLVEVVPSPQLIVAVKSAEWSPRIGVGEGGVASCRRVALPSIAVTRPRPAGQRGVGHRRRAGRCSPCLPPSSLTVTLIGSVPSSA